MGPTVNIVLQNKTGASQLYAHITGQDSKGVFLLGADGKTQYHPASPPAGKTLAPLGADCSIKVGASGASRTVTVPYISGARIWLSKDKPLTFYINPGPALVEPSAMNPSDPNYNLDWGFCEFTYNADQIYVNVSYVDFVSLPISLQLENTSGKVTSVPGLPADGLNSICSKLVAQGKKDGKGWEKLVIRSPTGANLRALSPNAGAVLIPNLLKGYYQPYVDAVWKKYTTQDLVINTQFTWGNAKGRVNNGKLTFDKVGSFAQPSERDIFSCNSGPFAHYEGVSDEILNIGARLSAAFNRSTLLVNANQPEGEKLENYYKNAITNHFSRICHETTIGGRGYAFPYDDVGPSNGKDQSGFLNDPHPKTLTIGCGGATVKKGLVEDKVEDDAEL